MQLINKHPLIGSEGHYKDSKKKIDVIGKIVAVRRSHAILFNVETMKEVEGAKVIEVKIKPNGGGRAFWSRPLKSVTVGKPNGEHERRRDGKTSGSGSKNHRAIHGATR